MIQDNIFDIVKVALRTEYGDNIYIYDAPLSSNVPNFPAVSIVCINNQVDRQKSTFDSAENTVTLEYDINVYSNDIDEKEEQAKEIATLICDVFTEHRYYRTQFNPIDNLLDSSIARYNAKVRKTDVCQ